MKIFKGFLKTKKEVKVESTRDSKEEVKITSKDRPKTFAERKLEQIKRDKSFDKKWKI